MNTKTFVYKKIPQTTNKRQKRLRARLAMQFK